MERLLTMIGVGGAALTILACWYFILRTKRVSKKSTADLVALFKDPNQRLFYGTALEELANRGEPITFAVPAVARMLINPSKFVRMLGHQVMQKHFPSVFDDVAYDAMKPSDEARRYFEALAKGA